MKNQIVALTLFSGIALGASAGFLERWQFNDAAGVNLNAALNTGTHGSSWSYGDPAQWEISGTGDMIAKGSSVQYEATGLFPGGSLAAADDYSLEMKISAWEIESGSAATRLTYRLKTAGGANVNEIQLRMDGVSGAQFMLVSAAGNYTGYTLDGGALAGGVATARIDFNLALGTAEYWIDGVLKKSISGLTFGAMEKLAFDQEQNWTATTPTVHVDELSLSLTSSVGAPVIAETTSASGLKHPGCLQSAAEINALAAAKALNDPYRTQIWNNMMLNTRGLITETNWIPPVDIFGTDFAGAAGNSGAGLVRYVNDWVVTGNPTSEASAITMLNTWAGVQSFTIDPAMPQHHKLFGGITLGYIAYAADLLMSSGTSWPVVEQNAFKDTLRNVLLPIINDDRLPFYNGNWDAAATWSVMAFAVCLDDKVLFDAQVDRLKNGDTNTRIAHYLLSTGQAQESTRDVVHTEMGLYFLSLACQIAWTQGIDLYEYDGRSIGKCYEYISAFNQGEDRLPIQVYPSPIGSNIHDFNTAISSVNRGTYQHIYEMVYQHYKNYRGIELPYVKTVLDRYTREEDPASNNGTFGTVFYWDLDLAADAALRQAQSADVALDISSHHDGRATLRLNSGGVHYNALDSRSFSKEKSEWNDGGTDQPNANSIANTVEDTLYQTYRQGIFSGSIYYHFTLPNGDYRVKLHFAEPTFTQANERVFNVYLEGSKKLDNFDIFSVAGNNTAYVHETTVTLSDGILDVQLQNVISRSLINAVEIEPVQSTVLLNYTAGPGGTLSGTTSQTIGFGANSSSITALPYTNYLFVDWSDGNTDNPRIDLNVINDLSVTANFVVVSGSLTTNTLSLVDSARIAGGVDSGLTFSNTGDLGLKDSSGNLTRFALFKADLSSLSGTVADASLTFLSKNDAFCKIYVWGVVDSAANGWDWIGGTGGDVTWDSVVVNGLFTPQDQLYFKFGSELVFLDSFSVSGTGNPLNLTHHTLNGATLASLINADTDGILTFVVAVDEDVFLGVRNPITYAPAAELEIVMVTLDSDGDGLTDAQEIALGTDPNDPNSGFGIGGETLPSTGKIRIIWPSATGVLYRILESPDLIDWTISRSWTNALTPPQDVYEFNLNPSNGFFKVEADIQ